MLIDILYKVKAAILTTLIIFFLCLEVASLLMYSTVLQLSIIHLMLLFTVIHQEILYFFLYFMCCDKKTVL